MVGLSKRIFLESFLRGEKGMLFGTISAVFITIAGAVFLVICMLKPGLESPLTVFGGLLILFCVPVSLMFGIIGVMFDRNKWPAIVTTAIAGVPVIVIVYSFVLHLGLFKVILIF
jgi:hypothetical protein